MPKIWKSDSVWRRSSVPCANTGSSHPASSPVPCSPRSGPSGGPGSDRTSPSTTDGTARIHNGVVMTDGDSWMCGSTAGSTRLSPQNVSPISRNM